MAALILNVLSVQRHSFFRNGVYIIKFLMGQISTNLILLISFGLK